MDISKLDSKQFAIIFSKIMEKIKEDPIENFIKAQGFMDITPSPAQEVILKTVFGKELDATTKKEVSIEDIGPDDVFRLKKVWMTEVEIYHFLTEVTYDPESNDIVFNNIDLICGRRSGKTLLAAIIAIYCAISNNWKPFLRKTPFATVLILSHSRDFSDEVLEVIRTLIQSSDILNRLINAEKKNTASTMNLKIPWIVKGTIQYSRVQIKVAAASSKTTRGIASCAILCDEIAYWNLSENMTETDVKILKAVRPAMKQFGSLAMLIKLSSPGIRQGVLYGEYKSSREKALPDSYAVFKAPTWMMNDIISEKELQDEYRLDKDGFDTEYRGNFTDSLSNFILPEFIDMSILKGVQFQAPEAEAIKYSGAIDAAYKNDAFTFSVTGFVNGRLKQYISKGWKGSKKKPVSPHEVAEYIRTICKQFNMDFIAADQYSFQPLKEIFDRYNVVLQEYTFTPDFKKKIYFNLKKLVNSQQIDLLDLDIQTRELKELMVEQTSTGHIKIGHPNGGSDDYATSLAISSYLATQGLSADHFNFDSSIQIKSYGLDTDVNGVSYKAPSIDLLVQSGHLAEAVTDNSDQYQTDPKTGKLVRIEDTDDDDRDDDGSSFTF